MVKLNAAGGAVVLSVCVLLAVQSAAGGSGNGKTKVEETVRMEVEKAIRRYPSVGPALVRLVFHDCWVNGCDGSVLLDKTPESSTTATEKAAVLNIGLGGFDVIDAIKHKVGNALSCADIVVLAGRDACSILSGGRVTYAIQTGRKDGVVSSAAVADDNLPASTFVFDELKANFAKKNFSQEELVILSGAHSIGVAHLSSFQDRLNASTATPIDPNYLKALAADVKAQMKKQCTSDPTEKNNIRDMSDKFRKESGYNATDVDTAAKGALDNSYYHNTFQNMVLFKSDWVLRTDEEAVGDLEEYRDNATKWDNDFSDAMAKLSKLPAEGSPVLELRRNCRSTNNPKVQSYYYSSY